MVVDGLNESACTIILGGGRGTRLFPLVKERSKPAVPLAAKYRMIDIPISNCINSGLRKIFILTQFNAASLNNHIYHAYNFDAYSKGFIHILAAEQTDTNMDWYQGTADAVRKHLMQFDKDWVEYILILSGDQIYRMDYRVLMQTLVESNADAVIATIPVTKEDAKGFGIMSVDDKGRVKAFIEKPKDDALLTDYKLTQEQKKMQGIDDKQKNYLASMGIYLFKKNLLFEMLSDNSKMDFGKDIIPSIIKTHKVYSYAFKGYWEDIGTIKAFFEANLALASKKPPFDFYDEDAPIYTHARNLSGSIVANATVSESLIGDGCKITCASLKQTVIGVRSIIREGSQLERVIMMGADNYETPDELRRDTARHVPPIGVGKHCILKNVIIDKNVRIGDNVTITNKAKIKNQATELYNIRDGIVIIPKNTVIKSGAII